MLKELVENDKRSKKTSPITTEENTLPFHSFYKENFVNSFLWKELYSLHDVENSIQKIKVMSFSEKIVNFLDYFFM